MSKTALIIIDVQVGNFKGSEPVYKGGELLATVSYLLEKAREAKTPVFYIQHCGPKGSIDEPGTPGWKIHPDVAPDAKDTLILKHHPDAFQTTALQQELESIGVNNLVITGIQTEFCVDTTCRSAYALGFEVILVEDGHSTWDTNTLSAPQIIGHHNRVLGGWFVILKKAEDIIF